MDKTKMIAGDRRVNEKIPPIDERKIGDIETELIELRAKLLLAENYQAARTYRVQISGVKDVLREMRLQEYYVTKESQIDAGLSMGQAIKSLILKIPAELPQMVVGLEYAEVLEKLEDYAYSMLTGLEAAAKEHHELNASTN